MEMMRFTFMIYKKDPTDINDPGKKIGVIVQDKSSVLFRSKIDASSLRRYDPSSDQLVLKTLDNSIKSAISQDVTYVSGSRINPARKTTTSDVAFLEDLRKSYRDKIQFTEVGQANYQNLRYALDKLYSQYVDV